MRFAKIPAILSTVMTLVSRITFCWNNTFLTIHFSCYFLAISWNSHNGWFENVQTVFKRTLCEPSLYNSVLSISKLTYFKWKTITAVCNVNGGVFVNSNKNNALIKIPILHVVGLYQFLKWTPCRTIWWCLLFYGSIACMNSVHVHWTP